MFGLILFLFFLLWSSTKIVILFIFYDIFLLSTIKRRSNKDHWCHFCTLGRFHQYSRKIQRLFLRMSFYKFWPIKFWLSILVTEFSVKLHGKFFAKRSALATFCSAKKFGEIDSLCFFYFLFDAVTFYLNCLGPKATFTKKQAMHTHLS